MKGSVLNGVLHGTVALKPLAPVKARKRSEEAVAVPVQEGSMGETTTASSPEAPATTSVYQSPFQIDHRGEVIAELRRDAEILREHARRATERAGALDAAAQHLEEHPPEDA